MRNSLFAISVIVLLTCTSFTSDARKKVLDHDVYDSWKSVTAFAVSDNGSVICYEIAPQQGDGVLYIENLKDGRKMSIERGSDIALSHDGNWAFVRVKVPFQTTRKAKIEKKAKNKMPKDSIVTVNLRDFTLTNEGSFSSFKASVDGNPVIAFSSEIKEKADTTVKGKKNKTRKALIVINPATARRDTIFNAEKFCFDKYGERLAVVFKKDKKDSLSRDELALFRTEDMVKHSLSEGSSYYSLPTFNRTGDKMLFLSSTDSAKTGGKHCALSLVEDKIVGKGRKASRTIDCRELIPQGFTEGLPKGMFVTEYSNPVFSINGRRIFLNVAECLPPKDTSLVEFETAGLDIWNWDVYLTPPMQKANSARLKESGCLAVIEMSSPSSIVPLGSSIFENILPVAGGDAGWALAIDESPYRISSTWDGNSLCDVYRVDLRDGSRTTLFTALNGRPSVSPCGKYICWYSFEDLGWHSYDVQTGKETNLTAGLDGIFFNDEDDHPMPKPAIDRPHWMENDEAFLLADKFDIWKITPDGSRAENLTEGKGRSSNIQYRYVALIPQDITREEKKVGKVIPIGKKETVWLTTFDRTGKGHGYASVSAAKPGLLSSQVNPCSYKKTAHARNSSTVCYLKGDFNNPMDLHLTTDYWANERKITDLKPQQEEYNWGNIRLVHWNAFDGTALEGLLVTPEDLDTTKKYPMMVYFYEKYSQELYTHYDPVPSRSVINWPFYASRGYVVFIPDIVYKDGHPGESAYNCICSGAEAMCARFPFINRDKMAIQGQSWGGYQTAYLVTRTDMFAAAGAGAPVGNMTSAYGGIRWGSGVVRAVQYEHGQSRIGKSMWEEGGLELYIENSPIFHTENVTTPVLIMHNDGDGAVPWYQGIEFFMSLRRFNHPAWLLQYNGEEHNLVQRRNTKDLSRRLQQFFDHYLKDEPMPAWMKYGVPYNRKGQYFGFEAADGDVQDLN